MKKLLIPAILSLTLIATPVFGETNSSTINTRPGSNAKTKPAVNTVDVACIRAATNARDNAIMGALSKYTSAWQAALQTRRSALGSAWGLTEAKMRRAAIAAAWKAYNTAKNNAQKEFNTARKNAWATFTKATKACRGVTSDDDKTSSSVDNQSQ